MNASLRYYVKMKTSKVLFLLVLGLSLIAPSKIIAGTTPPAARIAAVVNDASILSSELNARLRLIAITSGLPQVSPELKEQVLKLMINEMIQLQQAQKFEVHVSQQEIEEAYEGLALRVGKTREDLDRFLAGHNIPKSILTHQIHANLAWQKYIRERYQPTVQVGDPEVKMVLSQLEKRKSQPHVLLAEIVLMVENPAQEQRALRNAQKIRDQLRSGANFAMIAQQFSEAPSKGRGGDIGWLALSQLEKDAQPIVAKLHVNEISEPIRTSAGYTLYLLRERREQGGAEEGETLITFQQALFPFSPSLSESQKEEVLQRISAIRKNAKSCGMFEKLSKATQSTQLRALHKKPLSEITPPSLQDILANLPTGQASEPIETEEGILLFIICEKQKESPEQASRETIMRTLANEKLTLIAQRELRNLQRIAFIDIRE